MSDNMKVITTILIFLITTLLQMKLNCAQKGSLFSNNNMPGVNNISKEEKTTKRFSQFFQDQKTTTSSGRTFYRRRLYRNPCLIFGRQNIKNDASSYSADNQARFLWHINVHNFYSHLSPIRCVGDVLFLPGPYNRFGNLLNLFVPGILQNSLAATIRPQFLGDLGITNEQNTLQNMGLLQNNDQQQRPLPYPIPIQGQIPILHNSFGAPPLTPAQVIGGISTTVNDVIQRLVGTFQPVHPTFG